MTDKDSEQLSVSMIIQTATITDTKPHSPLNQPAREPDYWHTHTHMHIYIYSGRNNDAPSIHDQ